MSANAVTASRFPKITEEGLNDLRKRIGVKITDTVEPWNYEATRDAIRHYAHGIGDDNPLWCDPAYAQKTRYGSIVALPSFLFTSSRIVSGYVGGLSGVHAMWAGADWTWHKPVLRNDLITTEAYLKDLIEHQTRFAGRSFQQIYHVDFFNQKGDKVAECDSWVFRTDRDEARERGTKYTEARGRVEPFTDQQLAELYKLYEAEQIRGATPRYWEDVKEGDALPEVKVANLTRTDFVKYAGASGDFNPIHHDQTFAEASGNPTVFAMGMLNAGILSRVVTAFAGRPNVRRYKVRFATRVWPGDDIVCRGRVTKKLAQGGEKLVEGELEAVNQKGETLISGSFVAALPSRG